MKCVIYVRVSTDEQVKHGYSISAQRESLVAYAKSQNWEVADIYIENGKSAKDVDRPEFLKMMSDIKSQKIDVLLVYKLDRLTRSVLDLYKILNQLEETNCKFKSATEVYDTTSAIGRLFLTLVAALAQWERENLGERVRFGMEKKARSGKWKGGLTPIGYTLKNNELHINEEEKIIVLKILRLAKYNGYYKIAKIMNESIYKPRSGGIWRLDNIKTIVNNVVYAGLITINDTETKNESPIQKDTVKGNHEPIISEEEFWLIQRYVQDRKNDYSRAKAKTSDYIFSNILRCGKCGGNMSGNADTKYGKRVKRYRCTTKKSGNNCEGVNIAEHHLITVVIDKIKNLTEFNKAIINTDEDEGNDNELIHLENELSNIKKLINKQKLMYEKDIITIDELISKTDILRKKEKELLLQINNLNLNSNSNNYKEINNIIINFELIWNTTSETEKKEIISTIFKTIVVDVEKVENKRLRKISIVDYS